MGGGGGGVDVENNIPNVTETCQDDTAHLTSPRSPLNADLFLVLSSDV